MKKSSKKNNLVTEDYLDKKLKNFATKDYLDKRFDQYNGRLIKYINHRLEPIEEKLKKLDSFDQRLDKILNTLDWLVGKYTKLDEENTAGFEQ